MIKLIATFLLILPMHFSLTKPLVKYNNYSNLTLSLSEQTWTDWLGKTRKDTELIDDKTEKAIKNNRLLFILSGLLFVVVAYQSLIVKGKK